jgi:hypothetical protein
MMTTRPSLEKKPVYGYGEKKESNMVQREEAKEQVLPDT